RRRALIVSATATPATYPLSLHDALPICPEPEHEAAAELGEGAVRGERPERQLDLPRAPRDVDHELDARVVVPILARERAREIARSEEHTSELQSQSNLVCRLLLEKKKTE